MSFLDTRKSLSWIYAEDFQTRLTKVPIGIFFGIWIKENYCSHRYLYRWLRNNPVTSDWVRFWNPEIN